MTRIAVIRLFLLFSLLALHAPNPIWACSGACSSDTDCAANPCRYCDTDFGVCSDCCEFTEAVFCPTGCLWESNECRNVTGLGCGSGIPETPQSYRYVFFIALTASLVAISVWYARRRPALARSKTEDRSNS